MEAKPRRPYKTLAFPVLTPTQLKAATALGRGFTISDTARLARVDRTTIYEWLRLRPEFRRAVEEAQAKFARDLHQELAEEERVALDALRQILSDAQAPAGLRLEASKAVLSLTRRAPLDWNPAQLFRQGVKLLLERDAA